MKLWIVSVVFAVLGCSPPVDRVPPREPFQKDGVTYEWGLAHGVKGSLSLLRMDSAGHGVPYVMMTCENRRRGGVRLRGDLANAGMVVITAGKVAFTADTTLEDASSAIVDPVAMGEAYFAPGWFQALASAEVITVSSGGRTFEAPGPGAAARHYRRYCTTLSQRGKG